MPRPYADLDIGCNPMAFNYFSFECTNSPENTCKPSSLYLMQWRQLRGLWAILPSKFPKNYWNFIGFIDSMFNMYNCTCISGSIIFLVHELTSMRGIDTWLWHDQCSICWGVNPLWCLSTPRFLLTPTGLVKNTLLRTTLLISPQIEYWAWLHKNILFLHHTNFCPKKWATDLMRLYTHYADNLVMLTVHIQKYNFCQFSCKCNKQLLK